MRQQKVPNNCKTLANKFIDGYQILHNLKGDVFEYKVQLKFKDY